MLLNADLLRKKKNGLDGKKPNLAAQSRAAVIRLSHSRLSVTTRKRLLVQGPGAESKIAARLLREPCWALLRPRLDALDHGAIGPSPVVSLFAKRHQ